MPAERMTTRDISLAASRRAASYVTSGAVGRSGDTLRTQVGLGMRTAHATRAPARRVAPVSVLRPLADGADAWHDSALSGAQDLGGVVVL